MNGGQSAAGQFDTLDFSRGQFLRLEKYSKVAARQKTGANTIYKVASEAMRIDGFCSHISNPKSPQIHYGVDPVSAAQLAERWADTQLDSYFHKPSKKRLLRKRRPDKACAVVGVISTPPEWTSGPTWVRFVQRSISWLQSKFGASRLASVVSHHDEANLHLHFWLIPMEGESISNCHPGEREIDRVGRNAPRIIRDTAYRKAMAQLLTEFHVAVGNDFGLLRQTVRGRRLSREAWLQQRWLDKERAQERRNQADQQALKKSAEQVALDAVDNNVVQGKNVDNSMSDIARQRQLFQQQGVEGDQRKEPVATSSPTGNRPIHVEAGRARQLPAFGTADHQNWLSYRISEVPDKCHHESQKAGSTWIKHRPRQN